MATRRIKRKKLWFLTLLLIPIVISLFFVSKHYSQTGNSEIILFEYNTNTVPPPEELTIDLQAFWSGDLKRIEDTPLQWRIHERDDDIVLDNSKVIRLYDLNYTSPNWVGQDKDTIVIEADLYIPMSAFYSRGEAPAMLLLHGLYSNKGTMEVIAIKLAEKGYVVLAPDLPGHKDSEGAEPLIENLFPGTNYNANAHPFLSISAAVQGIRVLEELIQVDSSNIGLHGESYGGLIAMYLSGLYPDRISLTIVSIALGNFESFDDKSYFFSLLGTPKSELGDDFWESEIIQIIDPLYYLRNPDVPPIAWIVCTNDEIFDISGLNETYNSVLGDKWLQIQPNDHHGISGHEDTILYLADHVFKNKTAPPSVEKITETIETAKYGDTAIITAEVVSEVPLKTVELCYRYRDIVGQPWKQIEMQQLENGTYVAAIKHAIIDTNLDIYIIVTLDEPGESVWFTSKIYEAGFLRSKLGIPFWILIPTFLITGFAFSIQRAYNKMKENFSKVIATNTREIKMGFELNDEKIKLQTKRLNRLFITRTSLLIFLLAIIVSTFFVPWTTFYNESYNPIFFFNNFFTYTDFVPFGFYFTYILMATTALIGLLSMNKPKISGIINTVWGTIMLGILSMYSLYVIRSSFYAGISIGPILIILCGTLQIITNKWALKKEQELHTELLSDYAFNPT